MKNYIIAVIIVILAIGVCFADEQLEAQKKAVFKTLEKVKASKNLSHDRYMELVADAKTESNIYTRMNTNSDNEASAKFSCSLALDASIMMYEVAVLFAWDDLESRKKYLKQGDEKLNEAYKICFPK